MGKRAPVEIFMPPNVLKAKTDALGWPEDDIVSRAERAVEELKKELEGWIDIEIARLIEMRHAFEANRNADALYALYRVAHDMKGLGKTFDHPLVSRIAASLCVLTDIEGDGTGLPAKLIDAHVDAIKVIAHKAIKDPADKMACVLAAELEQRVAEFQK